MRIKLLLLITILTLINPAYTHAADQPKVGVILALTGPLAEISKGIKNGVTLASESADSNSPLFLFEDSQFKPQLGVTAVQRLVRDHNLSGLITFGSSVGLAIAPIAEERHIPMLSIAMSNKVTDGKQYVFQHFVPLEEQQRLLLEESKRRAYKRVSVVVAQTDGLVDVGAAYRANSDITIASYDEVLLEERSFDTLATKIIAAAPDAVLLLVVGPQMEPLVTALHTKNFKGEYFGNLTLADESVLRVVSPLWGRAWYIANGISTESSFATDYKKRFVEFPNTEAENGYDTALLFIAALKKYSSPEDVKSFFLQVPNFTGAFGKYHPLPGNRFQLAGKTVAVEAPKKLS